MYVYIVFASNEVASPQGNSHHTNGDLLSTPSCRKIETGKDNVIIGNNSNSKSPTRSVSYNKMNTGSLLAAGFSR